MDAQQELFSALLETLRAEFGEENVFDGILPPEGTPYPFVYLADSNQTDTFTKSGMYGRISQAFHVWHSSPRKRGEVSDMLLRIKRICVRLEKTKNYSWLINGISQQIMTDDTTSQPLLHGVVEIGFNFS